METSIKKQDMTYFVRSEKHVAALHWMKQKCINVF